MEELQAARYEKLKFDGTASEVAGIFFKNVFLGLITLGFYRFWGRVKMRRYLWQHTQIGNDRLTYTGTAGELLRGFGKFLALLGGYIALLGLAGHFLPEAAVSVMNLVLVVTLLPPMTYMGRRYALSRTRLRNVAFGMTPDVRGYWLLSLRGTLFSLLSAGWMAPIYANREYKFLIDHSFWGSQGFRYEGDDREVRRKVLWALPKILLTLGLYGFWLSADLARYRAQHTYLGNLRLRVDYTGKEALVLSLQCTFLTLLSFGLATPFVICRFMQFRAEHTAISGSLDFRSIQARPTSASATFESGEMSFEL